MTARLDLAVDAACWYADGGHRPPVSRCPATCNGASSHAERAADGSQRFYCEGHAYWRVSEVGRGHVRRLRPEELIANLIGPDQG